VSRLEPYLELRSAQTCQVDGVVVPAGTLLFVLSVHRLHVRARLKLDGRDLTLRIPRHALEPAGVS
jgi:hypothetical protein